jgi:hypothetical protein
MVVGGSNASRKAMALDEAGYSLCKVIKAGWRIDRASCKELATIINNTMKQDDPAVVVLQLLNNTIFFTKCGDGSRIFPQKLADGKFHVEGELVVASSDIQIKYYLTLRPGLDAVGS